MGTTEGDEANMYDMEMTDAMWKSVLLGAAIGAALWLLLGLVIFAVVHGRRVGEDVGHHAADRRLAEEGAPQLFERRFDFDKHGRTW